MLSYVEQLKSDLAFAASQGPNVAVITTQEAARLCLFEIEEMDRLNKTYFDRLDAVKKEADLIAAAADRSLTAIDPGRIHDAKK